MYGNVNMGSAVVSLEAGIAKFNADMNRAADVTQQSMQRIESSTKTAEGALKSIQAQSSAVVQRFDQMRGAMANAFAMFSVAVVAREFVSLSDASEQVVGKLRLVTDTQRELQETQSQLFRTANDTRAGFTATVDLYSKVSRATENLTRSQTDLVRFTESVNRSLLISSAGAQQSEAAILQLGQALASGRLQGDEFRSITENAPRLAQAIADGMGVAQAELKKLGTEGKLTSEVVFQSVLNSFDKLRAEAAKMPQTIGQSFQLLKNEAIGYVAALNQGSGIGGTLSSTVTLAAKNFDVLAGAVEGLLAYKLSGWALTAGSAMVQQGNAAITASAALATERAAAVASAEADVLKAKASVDKVVATQASVVAAREQAMATLTEANATIEATVAMGAHSAALRANATATQARAAAIAELAVLGQQQARISAAMTAATAAETEATLALTAAKAGASGVAGVLGRALGVLGGPIGLVTTALGVGVAAWQLWGSSAQRAEDDAKRSVEKSTSDIIADLDRQIGKLKERNALAAKGMAPRSASTEVTDAIAQAKKDVDDIVNRRGGYERLNDVARNELLRVKGSQLAQLQFGARDLQEQQDIAQGRTTQNALKDFMKKYRSRQQERDDAIAEFKEQFTGKLSDADLSKGIAQISEKFKDKGSTFDAPKFDLDASLRLTTRQIAAEESLLKDRNAMLDAFYGQNFMTVKDYLAAKGAAQQEAVANELALYDQQIAQLQDFSGKDAKQREQVLAKIQEIQQKKTQAEQQGNQAIALQRITTVADSLRYYEEQVRKVDDTYNRTLENISNSKALGTLGTVDSLQATDGAARIAVAGYEQVKKAVADLKAEYGNTPQIDEFMARLNTGMLRTQVNVDALGRAIQTNLGERFSDAFSSMVTGTESVGGAFSKMATGMLSDLAKLASQKFFTETLLGNGGWLSGAMGSVGGWGGLASMFGFSEGGYTGDGGKYEAAGVVHRGEFVVNADVVRRPGMMGFLSGLNASLPGFSDGGYVGGSSAAPVVAVPAATRGAATPSVVVEQNFYITPGSAQTQTQTAANDPLLQRLAEQMGDRARAEIGAALRPGGLITEWADRGRR
ncbi:hypothetical protein PPN31114_03510 [Pandoraea pneumonica]|uniref:Tape measure protein N-terminal domain-containing protein n=1 Tax=Pandoraea pneumonica TaxID=2508299 RepID=A0A5E4WYB9_9BURK|nr:tape measure protein [Pandoraea pneumonica]VVE28155.1 hypothetical protein PPN31114_03510 [Pandoraea pneumonica]